MPLAGLGCQASESAKSDTCPRPTTGRCPTATGTSAPCSAAGPSSRRRAPAPRFGWITEAAHRTEHRTHSTQAAHVTEHTTQRTQAANSTEHTIHSTKPRCLGEPSPTEPAVLNRPECAPCGADGGGGLPAAWAASGRPPARPGPPGAPAVPTLRSPHPRVISERGMQE